jgi:hypothetical protein
MQNVDHNEKNANFFAENCQKSQKIVIITSTTGTPMSVSINSCSRIERGETRELPPAPGVLRGAPSAVQPPRLHRLLRRRRLAQIRVGRTGQVSTLWNRFGRNVFLKSFYHNHRKKVNLCKNCVQSFIWPFLTKFIGSIELKSYKKTIFTNL